jgi:glycosyltransferase involved in cell wall biosynthesis
VCYEGAGKVVLEAYAAGVPALASRIGGLAEAVEDGASGLLLPARDGKAWAAAAGRLLDDRLSERLGRRAFELWRERYSPAHGLSALEAAYGDAMERAAGRAAPTPAVAGVARP